MPRDPVAPDETAQRQPLKGVGLAGEDVVAEEADGADVGALRARAVVDQHDIVPERDEARVGERPLWRPLEHDRARDAQAEAQSVARLALTQQEGVADCVDLQERAAAQAHEPLLR